MNIGLGISTTPVRAISDNISRFTDSDTHVFICTDTAGKGVSHSRNKCLSALNDCDYIFLMDDDVYPIMKGWEDYFISIAIKHSLHHFTLPEAFKANIITPGFDLHDYDGGIGAFRFLTKKCLGEIGGFNTAYDRYGFEDAGYTDRVLRSGINGHYKYPSPARATSYIFSEDVYARNPSVNISMNDKERYIEKNRSIYIEELNGKIFYPYD